MPSDNLSHTENDPYIKLSLCIVCTVERLASDVFCHDRQCSAHQFISVYNQVTVFVVPLVYSLSNYYSTSHETALTSASFYSRPLFPLAFLDTVVESDVVDAPFLNYELS